MRTPLLLIPKISYAALAAIYRSREQRRAANTCLNLAKPYYYSKAGVYCQTIIRDVARLFRIKFCGMFFSETRRCAKHKRLVCSVSVFLVRVIGKVYAPQNVRLCRVVLCLCGFSFVKRLFQTEKTYSLKSSASFAFGTFAPLSSRKFSSSFFRSARVRRSNSSFEIKPSWFSFSSC